MFKVTLITTLCATAACTAVVAPLTGAGSAVESEAGHADGAAAVEAAEATLPQPPDAAGQPADAVADVPLAADAVRLPDTTQPVDAGAGVDGKPTDDVPDGSSTADASPQPDAQDIAGADIGAAPCVVPGKGAGTCQALAACAGVATPGYCPGPKEIQCCTPKSASEKCDPKGKPQPNAALAAPPVGLGNCPAGMALLSQGLVKPFCIDRWEAALEADGATGWQPHSPYWNPGTTKVRAVSKPGQVPQGYVSGKQADAACKAAGKRLCSDAEWLRACKGPAGTTYPYGATLKAKVCNDSRAVHPAVEYFGTSASWIWSELGHPCINQLAESLAATGDFAGCVSAEGLFDLMGNLHEWTADPEGTFRGGFYVDTKLNGPGCLYATTAHDMGHWDYSTGFRCCTDAP